MATAIASLLVTLLTVASAPVASAALDTAGGGEVTASAPADRGVDPADRDGEDGDGEAPDNCPTELWSIPVEVEGLACVLLLPVEPE